MASAIDIHDSQHDHPPQLAHHFDSMPQQYEAGKLGMWLFLATEVLLFGGLFVAYSVFRGNHPEIFQWVSARGFLDVKWGAINTVVLILSSVSMAGAVTFVQLNKRWAVICLLGITFICGIIFLAIKSVEYEHKFHENLVWGTKFYELPPGYEAGTGSGGVGFGPANSANASVIWKSTCQSCHSSTGAGVFGQGRDIRSSEFIQSRSDIELLAYVKAGRTINDPLNTTGLSMPPKGGNPFLSDQDIIDAISYLRDFQIPLPQFSEPEANDDTEGESDVATEQTPKPERKPIEVIIPSQALQPAEEGFQITISNIPLARSAPSELSMDALSAKESGQTVQEDITAGVLHQSADPDRPANAHLFFTYYFMMTGLHGVHVLVGLIMILWLIVRTVWGHFNSTYFSPIDLGGLYWHIVDLIWIFLFPLFYLIS